VGEYASAHTRALVIGLTALATVIAGSVILSQVSESRAAHASEALERVRKINAAELLQPGAKADNKSEGIPRFATEKERLEGALAALDAHFGSSHGPLYAEAMLIRGGLLLDLGRADDAAAVYEKLLGGKLEKNLVFAAREGLGYAYERKGKLDEAKNIFSKLGTDTYGTFYKDKALYHQARLAELGGNRNEATRLYKEVLDKNPTTSLRDEITNRLAVLELQ
jgi:tetratricopeptide (TPR) repeat protein